MKQNTALNVCGIVAAVLLSVLLFVVLIVTPIAATVQQLTVPDNLSDMIEEIDYTEIVKENKGFQQQVKEMGLPTEVINQAMHLDVVGEITALYEQDLNAVLDGTDASTQFTREAVMGIFLENADEIATFAKEYIPAAAKVDQKILEKQVEKVVKERGGAVVEFLPPAKELAQKVGAAQTANGDLTSLQKAITFVRETLMLILYISLGVLTALLLAVRWRYLRCCLWAGVTFAGGGLVTALVALGIGGLFSLLSTAVPAGVAGFLAPLRFIFANSLYAFAIIYGGVGVVLLATFIVATYLFKQKPKTAE
ncbi:MAG: hypothetical protein J6L00_03460 [Clostridia bacterium]|nr:hypothetical protein [Clostridia bacterium]